MSAQHTPGPWKVFRVKNGPNKGKLLGIGDAEAGGITDAYGGLWRSGAEMDANACLIAAAPELLAAAIRGLNFIQNTEGELGITLDSGDLLRAAIAKARGEA